MWPLLLLGGLFAVGKTSACNEGIFGVDAMSGYDVFGWDNTIGLWGNDCPSRYPPREEVTSKVIYGGGNVDLGPGPSKPGSFTFGSVMDMLSGRTVEGGSSLTPIYIAGGVALGALILTARKGR